MSWKITVKKMKPQQAVRLLLTWGDPCVPKWVLSHSCGGHWSMSTGCWGKPWAHVSAQSRVPWSPPGLASDCLWHGAEGRQCPHTFLPSGLPRRVHPGMTEALSEGTGGRPQLVAGPQVPMAEWPRCQSSVFAASGRHPGPPLNVTRRGCSCSPPLWRLLSLPSALWAPRQYPPVRRQPDSSALSVHLPPFWSSGCSLVLIPSVEAGTGESLLGSCACRK